MNLQDKMQTDDSTCEDTPVFLRVEVRPVGPNDFGMPEGQIVPVVIPFRAPPEMIFRNCRTGALTDSDGNLLLSPGSHMGVSS